MSDSAFGPSSASSHGGSAESGGAAGAETMTSYFEPYENGPSWEFMVLTCQPQESLAEVRRRVIDHAEYGKWELRRSILFSGGVRKYWLRRRVMNVQRTL